MGRPLRPASYLAQGGELPRKFRRSAAPPLPFLQARTTLRRGASQAAARSGGPHAEQVPIAINEQDTASRASRRSRWATAPLGVHRIAAVPGQ